MHEYLPVVVTPVAILADISMNTADLKELKGDVFGRLDRVESQMNARFDRMEARQDRMQGHLSEFHRGMGQHDKAIEIPEKRK